MALSKCSVIKEHEKECIDQPDMALRESVFHGTQAFPVAIYEDDLTKEEVQWHWHEEFEVGVITEGMVFARCGARVYELEAGDFFFVNSGVMHAMRNARPQEPCALRSIVFHGSVIGGATLSVFDQMYVQPIAGNRAFSECILRKQEEICTCVSSLFLSAWLAVKDEPEDMPLLVRDRLSRLFAVLKKQCVVVDGHVDRVKEQRAQIMLALIHDHYAEKIRLKDLADAAHVSPNEALRCFKQVVQISPIQYLKKYRIQRAAQLFKDTDYSGARICAMCGFEDQSYFAREFLKMYGCTGKVY